jgi:hypothetical protein
MPQVEFEHTIPVFEWAKTVHALHSAGTLIGRLHSHLPENLKSYKKNTSSLGINMYLIKVV